MKTVFNISALAFLLVAVSSQCFALIRMSDIHSPKECPEGLIIKSTLSNGMIKFDVEVDTEVITNAGELYQGRTGAHALLNIAASEQQVASVTLHGAVKGKRTSYQFRISPSAAKTSKLALGVNLYEKNGLVTIGGGVDLQIHLAGFEPKMKEKSKPK